jgi:hypothetical protein
MGQRVNQALGPAEVFGLLYARFRFEYDGVPLTRAICDRIRACCRHYAGDQGAYSALTPEDAQRTERIHRRGNQAFLARCGAGDWAELFADDLAAAGQSRSVDVPPEIRAKIEAFIDSDIRS